MFVSCTCALTFGLMPWTFDLVPNLNFELVKQRLVQSFLALIVKLRCL